MKNASLKDFSEYVGERLSQFAMKKPAYAIPPLWFPGGKGGTKPKRVDPGTWYHDTIRSIARTRPQKIRPGRGGSWTDDAVIYNMFVRSTCAFDHDQNGSLDLPVNDAGWRETGSFLKAIALLPYIRGLGANTIHLLPITAIGSDGNKGTLGSPYAIRNPYHLDEHLGEPNLGIGVEEEFRMFVRCAHHLGMRVVVEFVFRTSSKDGDWISEHPEWYYWIRADIADREPGSHAEDKYGNPPFTPDELRRIKELVGARTFSALPPPHDAYRAMFTASPAQGNVAIEHGKCIGRLEDGTRVRIPGAFADWPPDDVQPPWGDVTYLKLYDHPDFNYIAYNTLRMYDERLAQRENITPALWERIGEIIPHYQNDFGIDGVMIDMGHALPMDLKQKMIARARAIDPQFAFWDENFSVSENSVKEGYNAVVGYQWIDQHHPARFRNLLKRFGGDGFPIRFFATAESHNTPRAATRDGGTRYSRYAWALSNLIPAIPFIHSGFELGETYPVNTGLDFTREELAHFPPETLPLFSHRAYSWLNPAQFTEWIRKVADVRLRYHDIITDNSARSFRWIETGNPDAIVFIRSGKRRRERLLVAANTNMHAAARISVNVATSKRRLRDQFTDRAVSLRKGILSVTLRPGEVLLFVI